jgi:hypothetical protein
MTMIWKRRPTAIPLRTSLLYGPDGKPTPSPTNGKAGTAFAVPIIPAHSAENIGPEDCHQIFVERK